MSRGEAVVITGIGLVSPFGADVEATWRRLCAGESALREVRGFDPGEGAPRLAGQVVDLPARERLPASQVRRMDHLSRMIAVAGAEAAAAAGLRDARGDDLGVVVGSGLGNMSESAQFLDRAFQRPSLANPMLFPNLVLNAPASQLAIALGWRGPNLALCEGEVSGEAALEAAAGLLETGRARAVIAAAGDEAAPVVFRALRDFRYLSPRGGSREWSSPFDLGANGPVLGEGAAALVLERRADAERRGATVLATIAGVRRFTLPAPSPHRWPRDAAPLALPEPPDVVLSGADSSPERDLLELRLLGGLGARPAWSWKGSLGAYPSAGLLGVALAALALREGEVPPLASLERPRETPLALSRAAVRGRFRSALVLGVARGGRGAAVHVTRGSS